jgi:hypothetical protein
MLVCIFLPLPWAHAYYPSQSWQRANDLSLLALVFRTACCIMLRIQKHLICVVPCNLCCSSISVNPPNIGAQHNNLIVPSHPAQSLLLVLCEWLLLMPHLTMEALPEALVLWMPLPPTHEVHPYQTYGNID